MTEFLTSQSYTLACLACQYNIQADCHLTYSELGLLELTKQPTISDWFQIIYIWISHIFNISTPAAYQLVFFLSNRNLQRIKHGYVIFFIVSRIMLILLRVSLSCWGKYLLNQEGKVIDRSETHDDPTHRGFPISRTHKEFIYLKA